MSYESVLIVSPRQLEVWRQAALGHSIDEYAKGRGITLSTAQKHVEVIMAKLNVNCRADLTRAAITYGVIEVPAGTKSFTVRDVGQRGKDLHGTPRTGNSGRRGPH